MDSVEVNGGIVPLLGVAALFGLVNGLLGPLLRLLSLPLLLVTFGLFALVINAALLGITAGLTDALEVGGFLSAVVAALLISTVSAALNWLAARALAHEPAPKAA
jgi:putative membrane protein